MILLRASYGLRRMAQYGKVEPGHIILSEALFARLNAHQAHIFVLILVILDL